MTAPDGTRFVLARSVGPYDDAGLPREAPSVPADTPTAMRALGLLALADELEGLRSTDAVRRPFVWRALSSATDVDAVRLRPLPEDAPARPSLDRWPLDFAAELEVTIDPRLRHDGLAIPRDALATILAPILAGLLVDDGCARDLGTAEPLVLAPHARAMVDPRIDYALDDRPLVVSHGAAIAACWPLRGVEAALAPSLAEVLGARAGDHVVVHLPLGELAIEEAWTLAKRAPPDVR
ncbi:MAG: hypothetical protein K1X94_31020 [Sandaracinaceae bacterium]|nr:hypothetical protein [Sandaracinaceae bacterium]